MKKLHINIETIKLEGRPYIVLKPPVDDIDKCIQNLSRATEETKAIIYKYSGSNQGKQYKIACNTITEFSHDLYEASVVFNDIQNQVVEFANKAARYDEDRNHLSRPRKLEVSVVKLKVNEGVVYFRRPEMIIVRDKLKAYVETCDRAVKTLKAKTSQLHAVWKDSQKDDYCKMVDDVCAIITKSSKVLLGYHDYLSRKIFELDS